MERWVWNGEQTCCSKVWNGVWNEMFKSTCSIPKRFDSWPLLSSLLVGKGLLLLLYGRVLICSCRLSTGIINRTLLASKTNASSAAPALESGLGDKHRKCLSLSQRRGHESCLPLFQRLKSPTLETIGPSSGHWFFADTS